LRTLQAGLGPSLGLWRAAEIAALREQVGRLTPPVLDLGCGDGFLTALVLGRVEIGLDPDQAVLAGAQRRGLYARTLAAPIESADLPAGGLGSILSNSVLEHVPRIDDALRAAGQALRPGGRLVFTAPTEAFSRQLALPLAGYAAGRNRHFQHLNLWSTQRWAQALALAGFEVELIRPYLRASLVWAWDVLELLQMPRLGGQRLFGQAWRRLSPAAVARLARRAARLNRSARPPGGGRLIVARKH
jgi:SAM-dependent methyltransferase